MQWAAQPADGRADALPMCRWLRDRGLDLAVLNHNGHSAVHKAAVKGRRDVCEWLLAEDGGGLGARHLAADGDGNTPALMARLEGYDALSEWLDGAAARFAPD